MLMLSYVAGTVLSWSIARGRQDGAQSRFLAGSLVSVFGGALKVLSSLTTRGTTGATLTVFGEGLVMLASPLLFNTIIRLSFDWFGEGGRTSGLAISTCSAPAGALLGYYCGAPALSQSLWLTNAFPILALISHLLAYIVIRSKPVRPASNSSQQRAPLLLDIGRAQGDAIRLDSTGDVPGVRSQVFFLIADARFRELLLTFITGPVAILTASTSALIHQHGDHVVGVDPQHVLFTVGGIAVGLPLAVKLISARKHNLLLKTISIVMLALGADLIFSKGVDTWLTAIGGGFVCIPAFLLLLLEVSYPVDEDTAIGLSLSLTLVALFPVALLFDLLHLNVTLGGWTGEMILGVLLSVSTLISFKQPCLLKRSKYDQQRRVGEEEPLLGDREESEPRHVHFEEVV